MHFTREQLKGKTVTVDGKAIKEVDGAHTGEGWADEAMRDAAGTLFMHTRRYGKVVVADAPAVQPAPFETHAES